MRSLSIRRRRVWWGTERGDDEVVLLGNEAVDAMDSGGFDGFLEIHRRHDGEDVLGQNALSASGRTNHQEIVATKDSDFNGALGSVPRTQLSLEQVVTSDNSYG